MHALPTFTLLTLGALFGTSIANERYKVTWYEDIGCDDFLGTTSDTVDSGCQNIGTSVPALSYVLTMKQSKSYLLIHDAYLTTYDTVSWPTYRTAVAAGLSPPSPALIVMETSMIRPH